MKLLLLSLFFIFQTNWEPNFDIAKKTAKEQHKLILLNFSGSDWCGPCILLRKDYLENKDFTEMANQNLIMVNADFPRKKKNMGTGEVIKRNNELAELYNKQGSFPLTILLNSDGKVIKTYQGVPKVTARVWSEEIKSICSSNKD